MNMFTAAPFGTMIIAGNVHYLRAKEIYFKKKNLVKCFLHMPFLSVYDLHLSCL